MQVLGSAGGTYSGVAPTMGSATGASGGWSATITNYNAAFTYSATTTAGSVSISTNTITQSGLGNNVSSTVTVNTTRSGYESASGTVSGTSFSQLATPTLGTATSAVGGFSFTITNHDGANGYTLSTTAGSASRSGSTVTVSGLSNGASATVSVTATRAGFVNSATGTVSGSAQNVLATPTFSITATTCSGFTASITNYDAANTYTQSVSAGSVSRSSGTLTVTGLAKGQSSTITVNVSRSGFAGSSGTVTHSALVACTSCTFAYSQVEFCGCFGGFVHTATFYFYTGNPSGCCPADCPAIDATGCVSTSTPC